MYARRFATLLIAVFLSCASAQAVTIDTVPVGNPGNPADTRYPRDRPNGVGSVGYSFRIGKTEITNEQYVEFLNAVAAADPYGLYNTSMRNSFHGGILRSGSSGSFFYAVKDPAFSGTYTYDDKPVVYVSSGDAMRFANWLHNRQPSGPQDATTTEDGAYTLNGATTNAALRAVARNAGTHWWLPSESEWYKAAYHKNDGVTANYWDYPTSTNSVPNNNPPSSDTGNSANFYNDGYTNGSSIYPMTDAGAYTLSDSPYGTFDQGGNAREWNETLFDGSGGSVRGVRGGSWDSGSPYIFLHAAAWHLDGYPANEFSMVGFRVATIPEPASIALCLAGLLMLALKRTRR